MEQQTGLPYKRYRKSSRSGPHCDNCVKTGVWPTSDFSENTWNSLGDFEVRVGDTKDTRDDAPILRFSLEDWDSLINLKEKTIHNIGTAIRETGKVALQGAALRDTIVTHTLSDGSVFAQVPIMRKDGTWTYDWVHSNQPRASLNFTPGEIEAFVKGVPEGDFDLPADLQSLQDIMTNA